MEVEDRRGRKRKAVEMFDEITPSPSIVSFFVNHFLTCKMPGVGGRPVSEKEGPWICTYCNTQCPSYGALRTHKSRCAQKGGREAKRRKK